MTCRHSISHACRVAMLVVLSQIPRPADAQARSDAPWSGWVQCQLDVNVPGYVHRETHRWTIAGSPQPVSNVQIYPVTWTVSGNGSLDQPPSTWTINGAGVPGRLGFTVNGATIAIRAVDARLVARGALTGTNGPSAMSRDVDELLFPRIDGAASSTQIAGAMPSQGGGVGPIAPANPQKTVTCTWEFTRASAAVSSLPSGNSITPTQTPVGANGLVPPRATGPPYDVCLCDHWEPDLVEGQVITVGAGHEDR